MTAIIKRLTALFFRPPIRVEVARLPAIKLEVRPSDAIVVTYPGVLRQEQVDALRAQIFGAMPDGVRVLVLGGGISLQVVAAAVDNTISAGT